MDEESQRPDEGAVGNRVEETEPNLAGEGAHADEAERQVRKEIGEFSNAQIVTALLDQIDAALEDYDSTTFYSKNLAMDQDEKARLLDMIQVLRDGIGFPKAYWNDERIRIRYKVRKDQDDARIQRGEDVGVYVEVWIPEQNKVIELNVWGSRLDYDSSKMYTGDQSARIENSVSSPRIINFHSFKTRRGTHGFEKEDRLLDDARLVVHRKGHPGNRLEVMRHNGEYLPHEERPLHVMDSESSRNMNPGIYLLTDELYDRRGEEEDY